MAMYTMAAPPMSVAVPAGTSRSVAAAAPVFAVPAALGTRAPMPAPPETPPPASLTSGMPDPNTIQQQKDGYVASLDEQLRNGAGALNLQVKEQRENVRMQAEQQKAIFAMQVDQEVRMQEVQVDHKFASQVKELKQQAMRQRALLEQQALQLSMEYQGRKAEEEMMQQHHQLHKESQSLQEQMRSLPNLTGFVASSMISTAGNGQIAATPVAVTPTPSHVPAPASMASMPRVSSVMVVPPTASPTYYVQAPSTPMVPMSGVAA